MRRTGMTETWILFDVPASSPNCPSSAPSVSSLAVIVLESSSTTTTASSSSLVPPTVVDATDILDLCRLRLRVLAELPPPLRRPFSLDAFLSRAFFTRFISMSADSLAHLFRLSHRHSGTRGILTSCTVSLLFKFASSSLAAMAAAITRSTFDWLSALPPSSPSLLSA